MSLKGPTISLIKEKNDLDNLSNAARDRLFGLTVTPPLAPPKGMPATAHFQVIHIESAFTSSMVTLGWNLIPPLYGPRALLCWLLKPWYRRILPSSILTGKLTLRIRLGFRRIS